MPLEIFSPISCVRFFQFKLESMSSCWSLKLFSSMLQIVRKALHFGNGMPTKRELSTMVFCGGNWILAPGCSDIASHCIACGDICNAGTPTWYTRSITGFRGLQNCVLCLWFERLCQWNCLYIDGVITKVTDSLTAALPFGSCLLLFCAFAFRLQH